MGIAGIDWNSKLNAIDAGPANQDTPAPEQVYEAVISLAENEYKVVNHSYGTADYNSTLALAFAHSYNQDVVTVAAVCNGGYTPQYPAAYPGVIAVASILRNGQSASQSSRGWHVDLAAPSANENMAIADKILTLFPNHAYGYAWGTSMAAPQVTGVVSLLRAWKPELSNDDVEWVLKLSARPLQGQIVIPDSVVGHGLMRADSAFALLSLPYTLMQDSAIGGSVVSTSDLENVFFPPILYRGRFSEVRTEVTFPKQFYRFVGAWARGSKSIGYSPANPNFKMLFAEFVPGTLTANGGTLRTYVWDLYSFDGNDHYGYYPCDPSNVVLAYSVLGEELLATPTLSVTKQSPGHHRLSWSDVIEFESNWHVDRKEGNGSWQVDYAVLPANSTSFMDSVSALIGSELYEYRIYPSTPSQTGSNSNVVSLRAKPKPPSCVSGYVVYMNPNAVNPVGYCSPCNTSECGGIGEPMGMHGEGGFGEELLGGGEMVQSGSGTPGCPSGCQKTNMLVVEWDEPENQVLSAIAGYRIARFDDTEPPF